MNRDDLESSWAGTREHLAKAQAALRAALPVSEDTAAFATYADWLEHNELELALDELEILADEAPVSGSFWREALLAAENMGLARHAERYRQRLPCSG